MFLQRNHSSGKFFCLTSLMILSLVYPRVFFISLSSAIWLAKNMSLTDILKNMCQELSTALLNAQHFFLISSSVKFTFFLQSLSHIFPGQRLPWATDHMVQKWASCPGGRPLCRGPQHPGHVQLGHQRCAGKWWWQIHLRGCKWWWGSSSDRGTDSGRSEDSYSVVLMIIV